MRFAPPTFSDLSIDRGTPAGRAGPAAAFALAVTLLATALPAPASSEATSLARPSGSGGGSAGPTTKRDSTLFEEDFEGGLDHWTFPRGRGHRLVDTGDPDHGRALALRTVTRPVYALVEGSEGWADVRIEGSVLFPGDEHNYLGFIYRFVEDERRLDFGSVYIKGNGSYVRVNPHRDMNVGRTLYEEYRTPLEGNAAIRIGEWQRFTLEVVGDDAHLYVGSSAEPVLTFSGYQRPHRSASTAAGSVAGRTTGAFGFKPRNPGGEVWIDDIRVEAIDGFSYRGPPRPDVGWAPETLLGDWRVLGPLTRMAPTVEDGPFDPGLTLRDDGRTLVWEPFPTDERGAVVTGRVTEHRGPRRVAYFHTTVSAERAGAAILEFGTVDDVAIWFNDGFIGYGPGERLAWWDMLSNPEHQGLRALVELREGENHLVLRVVGGHYGSGGFFAGLRLREGGEARER